MENLIEYRILPAINTFPQFNRPMSMLSPLDLSLRSSSVPITPPTTPSPPRKRTKFIDEHYIWRPHSMSYFDGTPFLDHRVENPSNPNPPTISTSSSHKQVDDDCLQDKSQVTDKDTNDRSINIFDDETIILTEEDKDDVATDSNDEEYVDILGNDDEESTPEQQFLLNANEENVTLPRALTRDKLVYEDEELHKKAMDGFAKLFTRNFHSNLSAVPSEAENSENRSSKITSELIKSSKSEKKRFKMRRQLSLDEDNTSPVSGTIIRKLRDDEELVVRKGDIDPAFNVVEITEEAKAILASIDNKIGAYLCQLCRTLYDDAFQLAQHRCPRIVHIEYKCSECEKVFNCPANLASHRRWHKPKADALETTQFRKRNPADGEEAKRTENEDTSTDGIFNCRQCGKSFRRQAYLKKHLTSHQMLNELKNMDSFKQSSNTFPHGPFNYHFHQATPVHPTQGHLMQVGKSYPNPSPGVRLPNLFTNFDHRRFHALSDLYLSHQLDRSSAFQYVQNQNLRGLPMTPMISPLMQMPVK